MRQSSSFPTERNQRKYALPSRPELPVSFPPAPNRLWHSRRCRSSEAADPSFPLQPCYKVTRDQKCHRWDNKRPSTDHTQAEKPRPQCLDPVSLSSKQEEVFKLLRRGEANKLIARHLGLSEATVKVHIRQIMRKLGVANRTQAAICTFNGCASLAT